jgi:hypothetical protein
MKVGVTGTREGGTKYQLRELRLLLGALKGTEFHHGDCNGVDEQAAKIAKELGYKIVCHPPASDYLRAHFPADEMREPAGYLKRDRAIVDACDVLVVLPLQMEWQPKGGTWYTHDYAVKRNKPLTIIFPKDPNENQI